MTTAMSASPPPGGSTNVSAAQNAINQNQTNAKARFEQLRDKSPGTYPTEVKDVKFIETPEGKQGFKFTVEVEIGGQKKTVTIVTGDKDLVPDLLAGSGSRSINPAIQNKFNEIMVMAHLSAEKDQNIHYNSTDQTLTTSGNTFKLEAGWVDNQKNAIKTAKDTIADCDSKLNKPWYEVNINHGFKKLVGPIKYPTLGVEMPFLARARVRVEKRQAEEEVKRLEKGFAFAEEISRNLGVP